MIRPMASAKASWGSVRKLPSGRYQARYRVDGKMAAAPTTFGTKRDAEAYLVDGASRHGARDVG